MNAEELVGKTVQLIVYPREKGPLVIQFTDGTAVLLENGFGMSPSMYTVDGKDVEYNA